MERKYEYDAMGRVTQITDGIYGGHSYTYDYRGFIKSADGQSFSYDANGNITSYNGTSFGYDATIKDKLIRVGGNAVNYASAASLNPTSWNGRSYEYEGRRLKSFTYNGTSANYTYDDQSRRIKKVVNGYFTNYYYSGDLLVYEDGPDGNLNFLYDENGQLYGFILNNINKYFYIKDILGNILGIVNENGTIVARYSYSAFGECTITENKSNIATINPFRFKGYYYDDESGMYYCQTRYFVPEWGRWLNADSPSYLKFDNINGMNLFAYCGNNPVMYADPSGATPWWYWAISIGVAAASIALTVVTAGVGTAIASTVAGAVIGGLFGLGSAVVKDLGNDKLFDGDVTFKTYLGGLLGGAIAGAGIGLGVALGVGLGVAVAAGEALTIGSFAISGIDAFAIGAVASAVSGGLGYVVRTAISDQEEFNWNDMFIETGMNALIGITSFIGGYVGGVTGLKIPGHKLGIKKFLLFHGTSLLVGVYAFKAAWALAKYALKKEF